MKENIMICDLCNKEIDILDARRGPDKDGILMTTHIDCWNEYYKEENRAMRWDNEVMQSALRLKEKYRLELQELRKKLKRIEYGSMTVREGPSNGLSFKSCCPVCKELYGDDHDKSCWLAVEINNLKNVKESANVIYKFSRFGNLLSMQFHDLHSAMKQAWFDKEQGSCAFESITNGEDVYDCDDAWTYWEDHNMIGE